MAQMRVARISVFMLAFAAAVPLLAHQAAGQQPAGGVTGQTAKGATTRTQRAPAPAGEPTGASQDVGLRQRVDQLEEQLADMQVIIGTLESLAKSGVVSATSAQRPSSQAGFTASDAARLDGIETQIRALTAQLEQLSEQVRQASAGQTRRSDTGGTVSPGGAAAYASGPAAALPGYAGSGGEVTFGSTTVTAGSGDDQIGSLLSGGPPAGGATTDVAAAPAQPALVQPGEGGNPKQLYETAYGYLLQQDYGAAESAFGDFLTRFPNDSLAGNAQYWLGESYFVRGQYKSAASAFLKGYQSYAKSAKAPDSLLKLAMSLDRLGQKDAACTSYAELGSRFPNAPAHVKSRAQAEKTRVGCP